MHTLTRLSYSLVNSCVLVRVLARLSARITVVCTWPMVNSNSQFGIGLRAYCAVVKLTCKRAWSANLHNSKAPVVCVAKLTTS